MALNRIKTLHREQGYNLDYTYSSYQAMSHGPLLPRVDTLEDFFTLKRQRLLIALLKMWPFLICTKVSIQVRYKPSQIGAISGWYLIRCKSGLWDAWQVLYPLILLVMASLEVTFPILCPFMWSFLAKDAHTGLSIFPSEAYQSIIELHWESRNSILLSIS